MTNEDKPTEHRDARSLINALKSKDKKTRYRTLDTIVKLSRSNKITWKREFLSLVLSKSSSDDWEERYIAMYAISRFYHRKWDIEEFKKQFLNVLKLIEDKDGRVRIVARNALEHFRTNFLWFCWGEWKTNEKELVELWKESLFSLWGKIASLEEGKLQLHLLRCIKALYQHDMEAYLSKKDFGKFQEIWDKINELDERYYEFEIG